MAEQMPGAFTPIEIHSERDFLQNMSEIVRRLNASPEIAKLVLVNPIYALEDLGVTLAPEMAEHVYRTFTSPPAKAKRLAELEQEIQAELDKLPDSPRVPRTPQERASVVFRALGVARLGNDADALDRERLRAYSHRHPLIPKLIEHESVSRGGLVFFPRATYDAYKQGRLRQNWVNSIRFGDLPANP